VGIDIGWVVVSVIVDPVPGAERAEDMYDVDTNEVHHYGRCTRSFRSLGNIETGGGCMTL
jgi:hypothetical protein